MHIIESKKFISIYSCSLTQYQHILVEHHMLVSTMENVHAKYEGLYANLCDILGKLHIDGNISVSFLNQKVLDTALES